MMSIYHCRLDWRLSLPVGIASTAIATIAATAVSSSVRHDLRRFGRVESDARCRDGIFEVRKRWEKRFFHFSQLKKKDLDVQKR